MKKANILWSWAHGRIRYHRQPKSTGKIGIYCHWNSPDVTGLTRFLLCLRKRQNNDKISQRARQWESNQELLAIASTASHDQSTQKTCTTRIISGNKRRWHCYLVTLHVCDNVYVQVALMEHEKCGHLSKYRCKADKQVVRVAVGKEW